MSDEAKAVRALSRQVAALNRQVAGLAELVGQANTAEAILRRAGLPYARMPAAPVRRDRHGLRAV